MNFVYGLVFAIAKLNFLYFLQIFSQKIQIFVNLNCPTNFTHTEEVKYILLIQRTTKLILVLNGVHVDRKMY